jgi:riboflavin synthase
MFTGIVQDLARVESVKKQKELTKLFLELPREILNISLGDSICINGTCLTVASINQNKMIGFDVVNETLSKTNISMLECNDLVNMERSMTMGGRIEGHILQGHVEGVGEIIDKKNSGEDVRMFIEIPQKLMKLCIEKGSISLDGVSLTIASLKKNLIEVALIPYTLEQTTLGFKGKGSMLNIETDILGKYVYNMMQKYEKV